MVTLYSMYTFTDKHSVACLLTNPKLPGPSNSTQERQTKYNDYHPDNDNDK